MLFVLLVLYMAALRINILTSYVGQVWIAIMGIIFMPMYMRLLGMEAFGLVGVMLSLQAIIQLFDFGIGGTANRELSRNAHNPLLARSSRDLIRTSEVIIWVLATTIILILYLTSHTLANHWLNLSQLTTAQAAQAITLMGGAVALLWPSTFYANCLSGLEHQPLLNLIQAIFATLRYAGVLPVMWWISPSIEVFLYWHALVGALQTLVTGWLVWCYLPQSPLPTKWCYKLLVDNSHFAGGLFVVGVLALGISQIDRLVLTSLRPLEEMGYYTLALSVSAGIGRMVQPMFSALYPRFSRLVVQNNESNLVELYHLSSQYLAVVLAAIASILMVYAYEVLWLWTGDAVLATKVTPVLQLLVLGSTLNGLMNIPYALQLAYGYTRLAIGLNLVSLLFSLPLCVWAVQQYGMVGAIVPWLLSILILVVVGIPLMRRWLLVGEVRRWYIRDNFPALSIGGIVAIMLHTLLPITQRDWLSFLKLGFASIGIFFACSLVTQLVRSRILKQVLHVWMKRH